MSRKPFLLTENERDRLAWSIKGCAQHPNTKQANDAHFGFARADRNNLLSWCDDVAWAERGLNLDGEVWLLAALNRQCALADHRRAR